MADVKLRRLLHDPVDEDVTLSQLIIKLQKLAPGVARLEVENTKLSLEKVKREMAEFKRLFMLFDMRIKGEVTSEVLNEISKTESYFIRKKMNAKKIIQEREKMLLEKQLNQDDEDDF
jgi:hypothetical protein